MLGLWSLEERRNRADLIEVFKIMRGYSSIPVDSFFEVSKDGRTRGDTLKLNSFKNCLAKLRNNKMGFLMDFSLQSPLAGSSASLGAAAPGI